MLLGRLDVFCSGKLARLGYFSLQKKASVLPPYHIAQTYEEYEDCCHMQYTTRSCQNFLQLL